jgi:hypothetical protein
LENAQLSFEAWMNGLSTGDSIVLGAIGVGLMVFALIALLMQRYFERRGRKLDTHMPKPSNAPVLGVRHSHDQIPDDTTGRASKKNKQDKFLSRLDRLA